MANSAEGDDYRKTLNLSPTLSTGIIVFLSALNIFLSITASVGNALTIIALRKVSSVHPPTKLLFRCLAVTDLCVGLTSQPLFATIMLNAVTKMNLDILFYVLEVNTALSFVLCGVSIFTSTAISIDRLLALQLGLRYRHVATLRRVRAVIFCFWLVGVSGGFIYSFWSHRITYTAAIVLGILSLFISIFSYKKIFLTLRQRQAKVESHNEQDRPNAGGIPLNVPRYKKTVSSILWVQLALVACYVPFVISVVIIEIIGWRGVSADAVWLSTITLLYLNSSLNPILYCWKIKEVRQAVKDTVRRLNCL